MNPAIWIVSSVIGAACFTGLGWQLGLDHIKAKQADEQKIIAQTRQAALEGAADAIAQSAKQSTKIITQIKTITRKVPVYRDAHCQHDDGVFDSLNSALRGDEPAANGVVP